MSAFIVSKAHIDALVAAGVGEFHAPRYPGDGHFTMSWTHGEQRKSLTHETASRVGQMLWGENFRSVEYRYPDSNCELPGPVPTPEWESFTYQRRFRTRRFSAIEILNAIDCLEYQSCEHPEWSDSEAFQFCDALRRKMIHTLPGYEDSAWGIGEAS